MFWINYGGMGFILVEVWGHRWSCTRRAAWEECASAIMLKEIEQKTAPFQSTTHRSEG